MNKITMLQMLVPFLLEAKTYGHLPKIKSRRFWGVNQFGFAAYRTDAETAAASKVIADKETELKSIKIENPEDFTKAFTLYKEITELKGKDVEEKLAAIEAATKEAKDKDATELKRINEDLAITMKSFDRFQIAMKNNSFAGPAQAKNIFTEFGQKLQSREKDLKEFRASKKGFGSIELESKLVGNLGSAANLTGNYFVAPQVVAGVQARMYEQTHIRDIVPTGSTNSNIIRYVRDLGGEGGPGMVAESALKPQIDRDLQIFDAPVRKIATYFRVPEEMIEDIPYLQSFLTQIGTNEVMLLEDTQILYGDGTGQNLSGLFINATAFAAGTSVVAAPNQFDVLLAAKKQGRVAKTNPTVALVSPIDMYDMRVKKDTTNNYLFLGGGNGIDVNGALNVAGLRIIEHTSVVTGDFLVFDPNTVAIFDRSGTTIRFYDQDQDNAIRNLITIVIEKRLALPIYRTDALIKGTFATAVVDLTS